MLQAEFDSYLVKTDRFSYKYLSLNRDPEVVVVFRLELKLLKTQNHVSDFVVFCKTNR